MTMNTNPKINPMPINLVDGLHTRWNHSNVAIVISFSGGKDSSAMLATIMENYPKAKKYVVMADTGFEHDDAIEWSKKIVESFGLTLNVVQAIWKDGTTKTFQGMVRNRKKFPSSSCRQCTSDLKRDPIYKWIRNNVKETIIINAMGLRADESRNRASKDHCSFNERLSTKLIKGSRKRTAFDWLPIHTWTTDEVISYLADKDIELHPAYSYLPRFSCRLCILMRTQDIVAVYHNDRPAFDMVSDLEQEIGFTMRNGESLVQLITGELKKDEVAA